MTSREYLSYSYEVTATSSGTASDILRCRCPFSSTPSSSDAYLNPVSSGTGELEVRRAKIPSFSISEFSAEEYPRSSKVLFCPGRDAGELRVEDGEHESPTCIGNVSILRRNKAFGRVLRLRGIGLEHWRGGLSSSCSGGEERNRVGANHVKCRRGILRASCRRRAFSRELMECKTREITKELL